MRSRCLGRWSSCWRCSRGVGSFVFTVNHDGPWQSHGKFKSALDFKSGVTGWVYHDLRRTVRSRLAEMGVSFEIAERILGHAMTKLERVYNKHGYQQEKAHALQAWADRLMRIVGDYRTGNVVELRPGGSSNRQG